MKIIWWIAKKTNQCVIGQINSKFSYKAQMIRFKLPYFGHSIQISRAMEKDLIVGKVKGKRTISSRVDGLLEDIAN